MQRGRGDGDDFFGFSGPFAGFGGFRGQRSLMSSVFGERDPFDDPFFSRPFGSIFGPSIMPSRSMFGPSMFAHRGSPFEERSDAGFMPTANKSTRPIIEELSSDDEGEGGKSDKGEEESPRRPNPSKKPYVQDPNEDAEENKSGHIQFRNDFSCSNTMQPQDRTYAFRSSTVTYGGLNGAYYTSSTVRRTGGDGVTVEESKEADTTTGKATHIISRGIGDKGHAVTRKLSSDGRVDKMQTLHNLNEDELPGFEEAWKVSARQHLLGWSRGLDSGNASTGESSGQEHPMGWALPPTELPRGARV